MEGNNLDTEIAEQLYSVLDDFHFKLRESVEETDYEYIALEK